MRTPVRIGVGWWIGSLGLLLVSLNLYARPPVTLSDTGRVGNQSPVAWAIDTKVDTVLKLINNTILTKSLPTKGEQQRRQQQVEALFAPSGYFIVTLADKSEVSVSAGQFLARLSRNRGVRYQLQAAKVIHFQHIRRSQKGEYSSQAVIYFDVSRFANHLPVTQTTSRVTIPLTQIPPAADYWQIYELKVIELSNGVLSGTGK